MECAEALEESIRSYESKIPVSERASYAHRSYINKVRLYGLDPGTNHIKTAPLFELFSVGVHTSNGNPCRIYGVIVVLKRVEDDDMYVLYERSKSDPEHVSPGDKLSLNGYPVTAVMKPLRVGVYLSDADSGLQIVNGIFNLEYKSEHDYDAYKTVTVGGEQGFFAKLCYNTFYTGMVGRVAIQVCNKNGRRTGDVYGCVYARLEDHYLNKMGADKKEICFLFKRSRKDPSTLNITQLELSRSCVAAPSGSFFWLVVILRDAHTKSTIVRSKLKIFVYENRIASQDIYGEDYHTTVKVDWLHPDQLSFEQVSKLKMPPIELPESSLLPYNTTSAAKDKEQSEGGAFAFEGLTIHRLPSMIGTRLVEVFSVVVNCIERDSMGIYGTIRVHDSLGTLFIFKRENDDYEILPKSRPSLSLQGPTTRSVMLKDFHLFIRLKDDKNRVVGKGYIRWDSDATDYMPWYDRPICSIIKRDFCSLRKRKNIDFGYTSVHYTIFSSAAQAMLTVVLSTKNTCEVRANVWGSITSRYNNSDYSTYYMNEFYRSTLFKEREEKPVHLNGKFEAPLPLSKCAISAPTNCSLLIDMDLVVLHENTGDSGIVVQGVLDFKPFCNGSRKIQASNGFDVTVWCQWKDMAST